MPDQLLNSQRVEKQPATGTARANGSSLVGIGSTELWLTPVADDLRPQGKPFCAQASDVSDDDNLSLVHATAVHTAFLVVTMVLANGKQADLLCKVLKTEGARRQFCTTCTLVCRLDHQS